MIIKVWKCWTNFWKYPYAVTLKHPASDITTYEQCKVVLPEGFEVGSSEAGNDAIFGPDGEWFDIVPTRKGISLTNGEKEIPLLIARTVKELREYVGLTQQELADKSGINIRQIQRAESDPNYVANMSAKNFATLCNVLKANPAELLAFGMDGNN